LIEHFGSVRGIKQAAPDALTAVVNAATAEKIRNYFDAEATNTAVLPILR
jgi:excinuclease ABC subunit C